MPPLSAAAPSSRWAVVGWGLSLLAIALLYMVGLSHWTRFFNSGDIAFTDNEDWHKERDYYVVLNEALTTRRMPYHMSEEFHKTDKFLGLPETNLSPQIVLLPRLGIGRFLWLNCLLMYSLGFIGCLLIRRRYQLGVVPFAVLFLLFHFNGFITSHLAVGHSMWFGYFLLSFVVLYVLEMIEEEKSLLPGLKLAVVLFLMILQGSFHIVSWVWMLLFLLVVFHPRYWKSAGLAVLFSGWLSFFRELPAAITVGRRTDREFWAGYPTLTEMLDGFIGLHERDYPRDAKGWTVSHILDHNLHWWEYDMYIGLAGLVVLVLFGIYLRFRNIPSLERHRYRELDAPLLVLTFLSLNYFYRYVFDLPLPLVKAEGVSSRFLIIPVLVVLVIAVIRMQRLLERTKWSVALVVLIVGGLLQTAFALAEHNYIWRIKPAGDNEEAATIHLISESPDRWYVVGIWVSAAVSLAAVPVWALLYWWARRSQRVAKV